MLDLLWLVPSLPFASAALLALFGPRLPRKGIAAIGVLSIAISAVIAFIIAGSFAGAPPVGNAYIRHLWTWIDVAGFRCWEQHTQRIALMEMRQPRHAVPPGKPDLGDPYRTDNAVVA